MAISSQRLAGVASMTIDGTTYMLVGDLTWSPGAVKRETLVGQGGVRGYSEMPVPGFISATLSDSGAISVSNFNNMTSVTIVLGLANGKTITGSNMWITEAQEVKTQEGTFEVRFEGDPNNFSES